MIRTPSPGWNACGAAQVSVTVFPALTSEATAVVALSDVMRFSDASNPLLFACGLITVPERKGSKSMPQNWLLLTLVAVHWLQFESPPATVTPLPRLPSQ